MPFIKKPDSKYQQLRIDAKSLFIGRTDELHFFIEGILKPEDALFNIISVWGQGGVGKSTLLNRFIEETHATNFKDYCLTAFVDERQTTLVSILEKFADQLCITGEFEKALERYKESLRKLQSERDSVREAMWRKATTEVTGSVARSVPVVGGMLQQGAELAVQYIWDELHYRQLLKDTERLENPISDLTRAFVEELNVLAETQVFLSASRTRRKQHVILFFDTFEQLAIEVAPWLLDFFLPSEISSNVILVIAGRSPLERSTPDDPKRWLPYLNANTIYQMSLNNFTEDETDKYLVERGITESARIETIWQLSRGLPLYLALLTFNPEGTVDPTADVVANFLRWIPEQEQSKRQLVLDAALLSRPFNQDEMEAFDYLSVQELPALYRWLINQPFIRSNPHDGRYRYHELAQELFNRHLFQFSPNKYYTLRRDLSSYYHKMIQKALDEGGKEVYESTQWLELTLALASQLFLLSDELSHIKAIEQILNAFEHVDQTGEIVRILREFSQDRPNSQTSSSVRQIATQLLQYIEADVETQEFLTAANFLLDKIIDHSSFSKDLLASIYNNRGNASYAFKEYQQAIVDYDRAIELAPDDATYYDNRGDASYALKEYQRAIADYGRAIELAPDDATYYGNRGYTYYTLKEYQRVIADYGRAIELAPDNALYYNNRGYTYYTLKEYQRAIADYDHAIELVPDDATYYNNRGNVYYALEEYQRAIADYDRAIELALDDALYYDNRGDAYYVLKEYQQALVNYDRAIELAPDNAIYYDDRGSIYYALEEYQRAIADYDRAIELAPDNAIYYNRRGNAFYALEEYQRVVADYDRAIELAPDNALYYNNRGYTYYTLKEYQRAIADYDRASELAPDNAIYYGNRGDTYYALEEYQRSIVDYGRAIELAPNDAVYYDNRGDAYYVLKEYQQALVNYDRAIELAPDNATYCNDRGRTYRHLEEYELAIEYHDRALELDPDLAWAYSSRGLTYLWMGNINHALTDYIRCWELDPKDLYAGYMIEWLRMCQGGINQGMVERLEMVAAIDAQNYFAYICRGAAIWIRGHYNEALAELESAFSLDQEEWDAYFWKGMVYTSLERDMEAFAALEEALALDLPPILLFSFSWLEQNKPNFYRKCKADLLS